MTWAASFTRKLKLGWGADGTWNETADTAGKEIPVKIASSQMAALGQSTPAASVPVVPAYLEYETVAVSTTAMLGATGAVDDYIEGLICVVATAATITSANSRTATAPHSRCCQTMSAAASAPTTCRSASSASTPPRRAGKSSRRQASPSSRREISPDVSQSERGARCGRRLLLRAAAQAPAASLQASSCGSAPTAGFIRQRRARPLRQILTLSVAGKT